MPGAPRPTPAVPRGAQADLAARLRDGSKALHDRLSRRDTLVELIRSVNTTLDPRRVADALVGHAQGWLAAPCLAVAVRQDGAHQAALLGARGPWELYEEAFLRVTEWVAEHGTDFMTADLAADPRVSHHLQGSVVALPLQCHARTIGALVALDPSPSHELPVLPSQVMSSLKVVLEGPALALDTTLHLQRVEELSVTDDLTSLYNSRYLNQVLRRESKRASRSGRPLSLLFLDLDGFKSVNDRFGHLCGRRALVEAASVIRRCARETDVVARFGGDEFAVVLPETGSEGALAVAERVRDRIATHTFLTGDGLSVQLTASIGVATLPDVAVAAEALIKAADTAMYRVKDHGKNGVSLATATT